MRYTAPLHTSAAYISTGEVLVDGDGVLDVPDVSDADHGALVRAGFVPLVDAPAPVKAKADAAPMPPPAAAATDAKA